MGIGGTSHIPLFTVSVIGHPREQNRFRCKHSIHNSAPSPCGRTETEQWCYVFCRIPLAWIPCAWYVATVLKLPQCSQEILPGPITASQQSANAWQWYMGSCTTTVGPKKPGLFPHQPDQPDKPPSLPASQPASQPVATPGIHPSSQTVTSPPLAQYQPPHQPDQPDKPASPPASQPASQSPRPPVRRCLGFHPSSQTVTSPPLAQYQPSLLLLQLPDLVLFVIAQLVYSSGIDWKMLQCSCKEFSSIVMYILCKAQHYFDLPTKHDDQCGDRSVTAMVCPGAKVDKYLLWRVHIRDLVEVGGSDKLMVGVRLKLGNQPAYRCIMLANNGKVYTGDVGVVGPKSRSKSQVPISLFSFAFCIP